jgi:hypothetical protein
VAVIRRKTKLRSRCADWTRRPGALVLREEILAVVSRHVTIDPDKVQIRIIDTDFEGFQVNVARRSPTRPRCLFRASEQADSQVKIRQQSLSQ